MEARSPRPPRSTAKRLPLVCARASARGRPPPRGLPSVAGDEANLSPDPPKKSARAVGGCSADSVAAAITMTTTATATASVSSANTATASTSPWYATRSAGSVKSGDGACVETKATPEPVVAPVCVVGGVNAARACGGTRSAAPRLRRAARPRAASPGTLRNVAQGYVTPGVHGPP